ncbi:hypothetical protein CTAYLR_002320 [Chrysophaeum taylorii]|uniref:tRNA-dihydrouridine(47) synthase [NAD(P)(+)] n=1 Tax=Chrysophaeum taylorii TaxID=2483200 RepID=A0AAD7UPM9_9STRA|nr:hypothetical protein CTAYLR_002320 [Chrysophaeum taylorii]
MASGSIMNPFDVAARQLFAEEQKEHEEEPVVNVGEKIEVSFKNQKVERAKVLKVARGKAKANRGPWVYTVRTSDGTERKTRLSHLSWSRPPSKRQKVDLGSEYLRLLRRGNAKIVAPMVGGSELAFRLLCRKYGAEIAYTPMMQASQFAADPAYRKKWFATSLDDRPLVAHFCGNDPETVSRACRVAAEEGVDAVDLNLGCPQRTAYSGHFGSYLLGDEDRDLVRKIVRAMRVAVPARVAVCAKIRLLDTPEDTLRLVTDLRDAGAQVVAIHGRKRATWHKRGPGARDGPADLDAVRAVVDAVGDTVCIVTNGNVRDDWQPAIEKTKAAGVMSAEGILNNPALFATIAVGKNSPLELAREYLDIVAEHGNPAGYRSIAFHVRRICLKALETYDAVDELLDGSDLADARRVVDRCLDFEKRGDFVADPKAKKLAADRKKKRELARNNRRRFEGRMARKAKREGKPLDYYLKLGADPPSPADLADLKKLPHPDRLERWKLNYSQVCFNYYLAAGGCERADTCAFLHPVVEDDVDNLVSG